MIQNIFFSLTVFLGALALVVGITGLADPHLVSSLHFDFLADRGLSRIIIGCGIGLIATAFVFFKSKNPAAPNGKDH
ncbi:hypothetical protein EBX93_06815 [bacterium]|nr:hypothetical protein [bacterium]